MALMDADRLFALIVAAYLLSYLYLVEGLKSVPSCPTCDYYFDQSNVMQLAESFNFFSDSSSHLGHLSQGPQLTYVPAAVLVAVFGASVFQANLFLSFIIIPIGLLIYYSLFQKVFGKKEIALACTLAAYPIATFPLLKYSEYTIALSLPVFLWLLIDYFQKQGMRQAMLLGIGIGIMGLSHANAFFLSYILVFSFASVFFLFSKDRGEYLKKSAPLFLACLIGFLISLLWWYRPLFVFGGNVYPGFGYAAADFTDPFAYFYTVVNFLCSIFFNFSNLRSAILCFACLIGVGEVAWRLKKGAANKFAIAIWIAFLAASFHFMITTPLLGRDFSPVHSFNFLYPVAAAFAIGQVADFEGKKAKAALLVLAALLLLGNVLGAVEKRDGGLYAHGFSGLDKCKAGLEAWVRENSDINDVFLSTPYACNRINGLTGRKCMQMDLGHSSKFDDTGKNMVDALVVIYGNSSEMRERLLREYGVGFFYWDYNGTEGGGEFIKYPDNSTAWMHPILLTVKNEHALVEGGVRYRKGHELIDPSIQGGIFRKFDVLLLTEDIVHNSTHPWSPGLDRHLEKEWECGAHVIYKVSAPG